MDTAYGYLLKQANDILRKDLQTFTEIVGAKAKEYKHTVMMEERMAFMQNRLHLV